MPKLTDTQLILLSTAAQRDGGSLLPLPETLADAGDRATKTIAALIKRGLAEELETNDAVSIHRTDGDISYGVFITAAGVAVIDGTEGEGTVVEPATSEPERVSKSATVVALLQRDDGATLADLIGATGWLPHTTRAALTGLRHKGHVIERGKRGTETFYRIAVAA